MAIIADGILAREWEPDGYLQENGFRVYKVQTTGLMNGRLQPNRAAHTDAREASHLLASSQSRAGGRER